MGVEYRVETYDFKRANIAEALRNRRITIQEMPDVVRIWETPDPDGMPSVEVNMGADVANLVIYGGSSEFTEMMMGLIMMLLVKVNDHVVLSRV